MRILLIKTSSLGDVVHNLPVVTDLRANFPDAVVDWVVEEAYADIVRLHPGVNRAVPVALRRWRRSPFDPGTWRELRSFRCILQRVSYDRVIDTQGLLKSALLTRMAHGLRCGYASSSAREPLAARFYDTAFEVPRDLHAVERNRRLAALAAGYAATSAADYGIAGAWPQPGIAGLQDAPSPVLGDGFATLLTATSRDDKLWPEEHWAALGCMLHSRGLRCLLPAGNDVERERAARIAARIPLAEALPPTRLVDLARLLAGSRIVVGVDTGLVHLAAALGRPTLALFSASDPTLTGVLAATPAINLGRRGQPPSVDAVLAAAGPLI